MADVVGDTTDPLDHDGAAAERRKAFFDDAAEQTPFVAVDTKWGRFFVSTADVNVGRTLFLNRKRGEMGLLHRVLRFLARADRKVPTASRTFLDVGANIGTTTVAALAAHGFERVVAIEPEAENYLLLELNTVLNGFGSRVVLLERAVSDVNGKLELEVMAGRSGMHRVVEGDEGKGSSVTTTSVTCSTVDRLASEGHFEPGRLGLMWIDVQGHEAQVLGGAGSVLERRIPILSEYWPEYLGESNVDRIAELVSGSYSHVVDFGQRQADGGYIPLPISELASITALYSDGGEHSRKFTNLLFFS